VGDKIEERKRNWSAEGVKAAFGWTKYSISKFYLGALQLFAPDPALAALWHVSVPIISLHKSARVYFFLLCGLPRSCCTLINSSSFLNLHHLLLYHQGGKRMPFRAVNIQHVHPT
jgi:hypothetical protein